MSPIPHGVETESGLSEPYSSHQNLLRLNSSEAWAPGEFEFPLDNFDCSFVIRNPLVISVDSAHAQRPASLILTSGNLLPARRVV